MPRYRGWDDHAVTDAPGALVRAQVLPYQMSAFANDTVRAPPRPQGLCARPGQAPGFSAPARGPVAVVLMIRCPAARMTSAAPAGP